MKQNRKIRCLFLAGMILAAAQIVYGEDVNDYELEAIMVTADKRKESIRKVPGAVTAFTDMNLEDAGLENIGDVIRQVPNLTLDTINLGYSNVNFRGIGISQFTGKNPVVVYMDGIPLDDRMHYDADLPNVESVEVLRGPQGTLYGKNAIGGVINVFSKKPDNTYEAKVFTEIGEDETYGMKAFANGPVIKDRLFLGLSGNYRETGGVMKNDHPDQHCFDEEEMCKAKALVRWLPSDRLEMNFHTSIDQRRNGGGTIIHSDEVRYHEKRNPDDKADTDIINSALNIRYGGDDLSITLITTYSDMERDLLTDYSLKKAPLEVIHKGDGDIFTQELRIQSPKGDDRLKWLGGLYFASENRDYAEYSVVFDMKDTLGYNFKANWPNATEERTMAAFGQVTLPVFSRLDFTAGLRYEKIHKELDYRHYVSRTDTQYPIDLPVIYNMDDDWDVFLPKGVLSWTISPDAMVYASVAKGYLAGGFNQYNDDRGTFDEQSSINYEIGAKTAWFDNRLFLNSTLFYIDIEDMHVWNWPQEGIFIASNAAKAHSRGIEIEIKARPVRGLDISGAVGWVDAEFDDYKQSAAMDYTGKIPIQTPDYTFNLAVQYRHASGLFVRGEMEGIGKTYYDEANTVSRSPYELYHAKIGYESSNWDIYIYASNLLDKKYFSNLSHTAAGATYMVGAPRQFGLITSFRF